MRKILDKSSQYAVIASAADLNGFFVVFERGSGKRVPFVGRSLSLLSRRLLQPNDGGR